MKFLHHIPVFPKSVWYAILVGLVIHLGGLSYVLMNVHDSEALVWGDGIRYVELAESLADGRGFTYEGSTGRVTETFRTPGLPLLVAAFLWIGLGLGGYLFFLTTMSAIAVPVLMWLIFRDWFPSKGVVIAIWLSVLEPLMWLNGWFVLSEIPFVVLSLLGLYFLKYAWRTEHAYIAFAAGAIISLSLLVRPAALPLYAIVFCALTGYAVLRTIGRLRVIVVAGTALSVILLPWLLWMHAHTGVYALSGAGWRNVYTDYLASVRAIESGTQFADEKRKLKEEAMERWDLSITELDNPANAPRFRDFALNELKDHKTTVLKIQGITFVSYFTNTDYLYRLGRLHLMPRITSNISASQVLVQEGIAGIPKVVDEMSRKFFMPIFERVWTSSLFLLALTGIYAHRSKPLVWLIVLVIGVGYVTSSAIGTGVEGRLRIPILPYYFLLTALGVVAVMEWIRRRRSKL